MIKAIFFDIDGTLISIKRHIIPESTLEAVRKVREMGVLTFLCTSRARQIMTNIHGIDCDGIVYLTGAHCVDGKGKDIACAPMDPSDMANFIEYVQRKEESLIAYSEKATYFEREHTPEVEYAFTIGGLRTDEIPGPHLPFPRMSEEKDKVAAARKLGIIQATGFFKPGDEEREVLSLMPHSHSERWTSEFVDVVSNSTSKAHGMDVMAGHHGFTIDETMAIGDGANDISMIRHAGIGVAMGNASDAVKAAADYVTGDVDSDGLAQALEKFVINVK